MVEKLTSHYGFTDVEIVGEKDNYLGFFKIREFALKHKLFAGHWGPEIKRELFERGAAVAVLPYDPVRDEIVLVEQFRVGALEHPHSPWLFELIAGMAEPDLSLEEVARKEAQEEAGLELCELQPMLSYLVSPGGTSERIHLFVAKVDSSGIGGIHGVETEGEDIKVHVVKLDDALAMIKQGIIDNAATIIGLQWLALEKTQLRNEWEM